GRAPRTATRAAVRDGPTDGPSSRPASSAVREAVADAVDGEQVARLPRVGLELAPDVLHVRVDGPLVGFERDAVHRVEELAAREHTPGLAGEREQELELRGGE